MRKSKKSLIAFLCVLIFIFNTAVSTYAVDKSNVDGIKEKSVVFLIEGQGNESAGDGTEKNPYRNIKTALKNVTAGGTIKLVGQIKYWKYDEAPNLLYRPIIIDKEVTFDGQSNSFITRAPIQLAADVTFKNIRMEFWASNELMPGVPDSGLPQDEIDEGTKFRSGRSIYLAGHKLTLDNVDTTNSSSSFHRDYRPYISGGTFFEGGETGNKAVLNVINPNSGTEFAEIYAGDYWVERNYPVELNINGKVIGNTIYTGGIKNKHNGDVVINIYNKGKSSVIDTKNHNGKVDVNVKENTKIRDASFNGIRNLTLEKNSEVILRNNVKDLIINDLTVSSGAILDSRELGNNLVVTGDFVGDTSKNNSVLGGTIFLSDNQVIDISGDVKGVTKLNSYNSINKEPLKDNHTYIKAKENATGDFVIEPEYSQSKYKLEKNHNNSSRTTWTAISNKEIFKKFQWTGNENDEILNPDYSVEYLYPIKYINEKDDVYTPFGEEWNEFSATLTKPDGTILDTVNNESDSDFEIYLYEDGIIVNIYNTSFSGEITLKVIHKDGKDISKKVKIGQLQSSSPPVIEGAKDIELKISEVDEFNSKHKLTGITVSDDKDTIDKNSIIVTGNVGKPSAGKIEKYTLTYQVTDTDNNTTTIYRNITVTNRLPEIVANDVTIRKGKSINLLTDSRIGLNATDYEDGNKKSDITVESTGGLQVSNPAEGKYTVIYKVIDKDKNKVTKKITVTVDSNNAPKINGANNTKIKIGEVDKFDLLKGITVTDDHDKNLKITVSGKISKPSPGKNTNSTITYTVKDTDGNTTKVTRIITVTNQLPTISGLSNITIKKGQTADLRFGVGAKDHEDGNLTGKIVFPSTNLSTLPIGKHNVTYKVTDSNNNSVTKTRVITVEANTITKRDLIGKDRFETATKISKEGWKSANTIILVNGYDEHLVDGLTATPLATALDAPVLLSGNRSISKTTVDEIKRLNPSKIIVIGGTGAVNESVINELKNINKNMSVKRIGGKNRYETSLNIAKELDAIVPIKKIYVGAGNGEPDSLSISSVAGRDKSPIILTSKESVDSNTFNYLKSKRLTDAYFIGGTGVISNKVIDQINGIVSKNVSGNRVDGKNRNETNANVIKKFYPETTLKGVVIAKDLDLVDALAVGPLAAKKNIPVVLAQKSLSTGQEAVLKSKTTNIIFQAGGGVNTSVLEKLKKLLTI